MEIIDPTACSLSRARGFLASLIFMNSTTEVTGQNFNINARLFQNTEQWAILHHANSQLEETRLRLVKIKRAIGLACPDNLLNSFDNPTFFYETAISGFHNTLLGQPPTVLEDIVALCAVSHATFSYLYGTCNYISCDFGVWRNAISNYQHRQLFDVLVKAVCVQVEPYSTTLMNPFPVSQYKNGLSNQALDYSWNHNLITSTLSPILASQNVYPPTHDVGGNLQAPDLHSLQGSPIVADFTHFLEGCGELLLILSGLDVTATMCDFSGTSISSSIGSGDEHDLKRLYIQLLQEGGPLDNPIVQSIVSVAERFIDLGYLQSMDGIRCYMLLIGKEVLPNNKTFSDFCQSVCATLDIERHVSPLLHVPNTPTKSKRVPCGVCGKVFTRATNMKRHMKRKKGCGAPSHSAAASPPLRRDSV